MPLSPAPRFKICCIQSHAEAQQAIRAGAAALGLVSQMPSGPGVIDEAQIAAIARRTPPGVATFLLTSLQDWQAIAAQQRRCQCNTIQLVDTLPLEHYAPLRHALPGIRIVQVIHVQDAHALTEAQQIAPLVDALLLDSGNPMLPVKQLGGTGRTHDWAISRQIRERVPVPVFLAGGLRAENVAAAITQVQPFALDVCSGVRTDGILDPTKLAAFVAQIQAAVSVV